MGLTMESLKKLIGSSVKDVADRDLGKLVGVVSDIKGEVSSVSVELIHGNFESFPAKQVSIIGDNLKLLQNWTIDADELTKELDLLIRRDRALNELRVGGDVDDATYKRLKEQSRLARDDLLKRSEDTAEKLAERVQSVDDQIAVIQSLMANNKMHYTSGEITEDVYTRANESIQNGLHRFSSERKDIVDKINTLIASRDSVENLGEPILETETKPQKLAQGPPGLTKTGGPRDIVVVRMEP